MREACLVLAPSAALLPALAVEYPTRCATRSTCGQALDFWNQNGKKEYILPCRYSRLKDE